MALNYKLIGKRIKESRIQLNISQAELAERINTSVSYISLIENAQKQASLEILELIANELYIRITDLLFVSQIKSDAYDMKFELLLSSCTSSEKRIIFDMAQALIASLRKADD